MPVIRRAETDILRLRTVVDGFVNPTNCIGVMSMGLSMAFRNYYGERMFKAFHKDCNEKGRVKIGHVHVWTDPEEKTELLHLPTKRHYADPYEMDYLKRSLRGLREFLSDRPFYAIATPLLGYGLGDLDKDEVEALTYEYLDDLPNPIHICQLPKAFPDAIAPKYLAIAGSRVLTDRAYVKSLVEETLDTWEMKPSDFEGLVSGGAKGVDAIACGTSLKDDSYATSLAAELKMKPIIIQADWDRYGRTAGFKRNTAVADIASHIITTLDERKQKSSGTRHLIRIIEDWNISSPDRKKMLVVGNYNPTD